MLTLYLIKVDELEIRNKYGKNGTGFEEID